MDTELLKGTLSLLILSLLSRKSMYGYEIAATVHRDTDGTFTWREGSLYPSLHRMEADDLIVGQWEEKEMDAEVVELEKENTVFCEFLRVREEQQETEGMGVVEAEGSM